MKYILLIHHGTTPTPGTDPWESLSDEEKHGVYAAYQALNETPGFTPGVRMDDPDTATTVRVQDGQTLTTDGPFVDIKEALGGYCCTRPTTSTPRSSWPRRSPRPTGRRDRDPADRRVTGLSRPPSATNGAAFSLR